MVLAPIADHLLALISDRTSIAREKLDVDATLESLGIDSLTTVELLMEIEEKYGVYLSVDEGMSQIRTLGGLIEHLVGEIGKNKVA